MCIVYLEYSYSKPNFFHSSNQNWSEITRSIINLELQQVRTSCLSRSYLKILLKSKKTLKIFLLFYVFSFKVKFGNTYRVGQKYPIYLNIVLLLTLCKNYPKRVEYDGGLFGKGFFFISVRVYLDLLRTYLA